MFVANPSFTPSRAAAAVALSPATPWLIAWTAIGALALLLVGAARGDALMGATLPFWLVGAPLIDLVWVERAHARAWLSRRMSFAGIGGDTRRRRRTSSNLRLR